MKNNIIHKIQAVLCIAVMIISVIHAYSAPVYGAPDGGDEVELPKAYDYISFDGDAPLNGLRHPGFMAVKRLFQYSDNAIIDIVLPKTAYSDDAISGSSLYFDGSFGLKYNNRMETESYSFGYWIKPEVIELFVPTLILVKSSFSADEFLSVTLTTGMFSPDAWSHITQPDDIRYSTGIENGLITNEWIYVTICVNGDVSPDEYHSALDLYLNGYHVASGLAPKGLLSEGYNIWFGINIWDNPYRGYLDELVMYSSCLSEEQVKALFLKHGGSADAKNPLDNEPPAPVPGNNGNIWDEPYEWDILEPIYTTLDNRFQVNGFLRPTANTNVNSGSSGGNTPADSAPSEAGNASGVKMFLPANSEYTVNVYYCVGVLLFLVGGVLLLAVYKKNKNRY